MTLAQRIAVAMGLLVMVFLAVWPPWYVKMHDPTTVTQTYYRAVGHHPVSCDILAAVRHSKGKRLQITIREMALLREKGYTDEQINTAGDVIPDIIYGQVDRDRLTLEWFAVAGLTFAAVVLLGHWRRK